MVHGLVHWHGVINVDRTTRLLCLGVTPDTRSTHSPICWGSTTCDCLYHGFGGRSHQGHIISNLSRVSRRHVGRNNRRFVLHRAHQVRGGGGTRSGTGGGGDDTGRFGQDPFRPHFLAETSLNFRPQIWTFRRTNMDVSAKLIINIAAEMSLQNWCLSII